VKMGSPVMGIIPKTDLQASASLLDMEQARVRVSGDPGKAIAAAVRKRRS
jgi:hypothetical protein